MTHPCTTRTTAASSSISPLAHALSQASKLVNVTRAETSHLQEPLQTSCKLPERPPVGSIVSFHAFVYFFACDPHQEIRQSSGDRFPGRAKTWLPTSAAVQANRALPPSRKAKNTPTT
ncbi:uncharacterized protein CYBJADRAFT_23579 [Cyberlindnera jadinii NRRL Y-1542]|uniref:Uncharacterized protein n=1 Tax=Cyberlindnera jadinii (strain ATCC 18201 / CBS 1600 / BCRC 20928 / JCM 3617 / NBRC 0987 / NRRL Y-1542) TaxID=983966 RepID=A0A1E4RY31_CYBJN|nr:hypothetical protein CYBJADRAFT_23579 [Cyberlindnera jadinii NRRL Y-1542]ODV72168.1 hypothetical protein CYBJADRAFT_23579 [Cyberlindnera jadinii NRRL Y-1542]